MAFWQHKSLAQMTTDEWESLCDGCGKCCLHKLEDEDSGELYFTRVACQLLTEKARCGDYPDRLKRVPDCLNVREMSVQQMAWLPSTCAYRLLTEGKELPGWHPLITGDAASVVAAGQSVCGRVISEQHVHPDSWQEHIVHWVSAD